MEMERRMPVPRRLVAFRFTKEKHMSDTVLEIIARAVNDEEFRKLLFTDPDKALEGYNLSDEERALLSSLDEESLATYGGELGDRTTKGMWPGIG